MSIEYKLECSDDCPLIKGQPEGTVRPCGYGFDEIDIYEVGVENFPCPDNIRAIRDMLAKLSGRKLILQALESEVEIYDRSSAIITPGSEIKVAEAVDGTVYFYAKKQ